MTVGVGNHGAGKGLLKALSNSVSLGVGLAKSHAHASTALRAFLRIPLACAESFCPGCPAWQEEKTVCGHESLFSGWLQIFGSLAIDRSASAPIALRNLKE